MSRRRPPAHGMTRDRARQITERRLVEAAEEGRLPPGSDLVVELVVPLMTRLVDLTVQGTQAAYCGRDYLGRELFAAHPPDRTWRGKVRDRFSLSTVGRVHRIAVALDLIRVRWRYDKAADRWLPALRWLSASLLAELGQVARERSPRRPQPKAPTPEELERRRLQSEQAAERAAEDDRPAATPVAAEEAPSPMPEQAGRARAVREELKRSTGPPGAPEVPAAT